MKLSEQLSVDYYCQGKEFTIKYCVDQKEGKIKVTFPFILDFDKTFDEYFAVSCTVLLAGLTLPKTIKTSFPFHQKKLFLEIIEMVYDAISKADNADLVNLPEIISPASNNPKLKFSPKPKSAILLWSGGVDSTYSYLLLKKNKFDVLLLHSDANQLQSTAEKQAVQRLSQKINVFPEVINIEFPELRELGKEHINNFDVFPYYNAIPFGRDIIHIFAALYFNFRTNSKHICTSNEADLWEYTVNYKGKKLHTPELQSKFGNNIVNKILQGINKEITLFSPISHIPKYKVYTELAKEKLLDDTTSCFFSYKGKNCGKCDNCYLYESLRALARGSKPRPFKKFIKSSEKSTIKEMYAEIFYILYFESVQKHRENPEYNDKINKFFGELLDKTKQQAIEQVNQDYSSGEIFTWGPHRLLQNF